MSNITRSIVVGVILGSILYMFYILIFPPVSIVHHDYSSLHSKEDLLSAPMKKQQNLPKDIALNKNVTVPLVSITKSVEKESVTIKPPEKAEASKFSDGELSKPPKNPTMYCFKLKKKHSVVPGKSWGTLTEEMQKRWTELSCDQLLGDETSSDKEVIEQPTKVIDEPTQKQEVAANHVLVNGFSIPAYQDGAVTSTSREDHEWCWVNRKKFEVKPMQSWGKLPENLITVWKSKQCDVVFTTQRLLKRSLPSCTNHSAHSGDNSKLPLIAIMAGSTTRKVHPPVKISKLALFNYLLPSLTRTLDCGFRYEYVLGYDVSDPYYDTKQGMKEVEVWFEQHIHQPLLKNNLLLTLRTVRVHNTIKKPGPVFLEMARAAYKAGAEYYYRVNDDTEFVHPWPRAFVDTLHALQYPLYGVVGPTCDQGNQKILTHDFVHRRHIEIFEMNYYPPALSDWWMDDWISLVYGQTRTFKARDIKVIHHTGAHGQRYEVDFSHEHMLSDLVIQGRKRLRQVLQRAIDDNSKDNKYPHLNKKLLETFDQDEYKAGFVHRDIPAKVKESYRAQHPLKHHEADSGSPHEGKKHSPHRRRHKPAPQHM